MKRFFSKWLPTLLLPTGTAVICFADITGGTLPAFSAPIPDTPIANGETLEHGISAEKA